MNVYDFYDTIYASDSTVDFFFYCLKKKPAIIRYVPRQIFGACRYALKRITKEEFKEAFFVFLSALNEPEEYVEAFWNANEKKIKPWYQKQKRVDDMIISASPQFLIEPMGERLNIQKVIASPVDIHTGKYFGSNCKGEEKVRRFYEYLPDGVIEEFYSDSHSDLPMAKIAQKSFLVNGNILNTWNVED